MIHELLVHLQANWHKYGIAFLLLKEARSVYRFLAGLKSLQETWTWLKQKLGFKSAQ